MYRTEAERQSLWERDQIHFAEIAEQHPCDSVPTIGDCLRCDIKPDKCKNKAELAKEIAAIRSDMKTIIHDHINTK